MTEDYVSRPEPLAGYRELTDEERAAVDRIKQLEVEVGRLWRDVKAMPNTDPRMIQIAKTELQDAFMWFVQSVTRPRDVYDES